MYDYVWLSMIMYDYVWLCMYVCSTYVRTYVCMYACMYVCMHACTYVCMYDYVCMYVCKYVCMLVCLYVCLYVCMFYVCMYVCLYVCLYVYVLYVFMYVCLSVCLYMCMCMCMCMYMYMYMSVCMSVCLSICLSVYVCIYTSCAYAQHREWIKISKGENGAVCWIFMIQSFSQELNPQPFCTSPLKIQRLGHLFTDGEAWSTTSWMSFIATQKKKEKQKSNSVQYYLSFGFDFSIFSNCFLVYRSDSSDFLGPPTWRSGRCLSHVVLPLFGHQLAASFFLRASGNSNKTMGIDDKWW